MKRLYDAVVLEHFQRYRQMLFLVGPRQVGKTTVSRHQLENFENVEYFNWDKRIHRQLILNGPDFLAKASGLDTLQKSKPLIVLDEIQKYREWKDFLKGFFDTYPEQMQILVTGSARLDLFRASGDSLMGRYFSYTVHPLSVGELLETNLRDNEINTDPAPLNSVQWNQLIRYGGFPEAFIQGNDRFSKLWSDLRHKQLFEEDLREMTRIQELGQIELLAELIRRQVGQQANYSSFATKLNISVDTVKRWIMTLGSFFYCYLLRPWSRNIARSLIKEPKIYLWDWSNVEDEGMRLENMVASHLLKFVNFWRDRGFGNYDLFYLRDKEQREVDFIVTKDDQPWFLVEVKKSGNTGISPSLYYYQQQTGAKHAFQVGFDAEFVARNCFEFEKPIAVPALTFLAQLI